MNSIQGYGYGYHGFVSRHAPGLLNDIPRLDSIPVSSDCMRVFQDDGPNEAEEACQIVPRDAAVGKRRSFVAGVVPKPI